VVLDMVAGDYVAREVSAWPKMAAGHHRGAGRRQERVQCRAGAAPRLTITGSTCVRGPVAFKAAIAQALRQQVWPLIGKRARSSR
jgi:NADPH2:quinone reductase